MRLVLKAGSSLALAQTRGLSPGASSARRGRRQQLATGASDASCAEWTHVEALTTSPAQLRARFVAKRAGFRPECSVSQRIDTPLGRLFKHLHRVGEPAKPPTCRPPRSFLSVEDSHEGEDADQSRAVHFHQELSLELGEGCRRSRRCGAWRKGPPQARARACVRASWAGLRLRLTARGSASAWPWRCCS
jgi:hypothetical protein